jgi:3-oxoacyl-ACP reductase-like protein
MADSVDSASAATNPQVAPKKTKSTKKPRTKPVHPRTSEMVANAIKSLKERGGSSLQAIKKYIAANYKVDSEKLSPFIKKYLKTAVTSGELVQAKGREPPGRSRLKKLRYLLRQLEDVLHLHRR